MFDTQIPPEAIEATNAQPRGRRLWTSFDCFIKRQDQANNAAPAEFGQQTVVDSLMMLRS
jgi:hypothetical protein